MIYILTFVIIGAILMYYLEKERKKHKLEKLNNLSDFTATSQVYLRDGKYLIAIDNKRRKLCIVEPFAEPKVFDRDSILDISIEIESDFNINGTTTGALVGGAIAGKSGATIGALLNSSPKTTIKGIYLKLITESNPSIKVNFLKIDNANVKNPQVRADNDLATQWKLKIEAL